MKKIEEIHRNTKLRKQYILIDYVNMGDSNGGRAIKTDDKLIITLPRKIIENILDGDGNLQMVSVNNVQKIMAHELGHIVLHADLLSKHDTMGSNKLDYMDWESEIFVKELLGLYRKKSTVQIK